VQKKSFAESDKKRVFQPPLEAKKRNAFKTPARGEKKNKPRPEGKKTYFEHNRTYCLEKKIHRI
jgi:hypothetical protein